MCFLVFHCSLWCSSVFYELSKWGLVIFCFHCSGFMGDKIFSLSLILFAGRMSDSCNSCFVGDFALLGVVLVGLVEPTCVFVWTKTFDFSPFLTRWCAGAG